MSTSVGVGSRNPAGAITSGAEAGGVASQPPAGPRSRALPGAARCAGGATHPPPDDEWLREEEPVPWRGKVAEYDAAAPRHR